MTLTAPSIQAGFEPIPGYVLRNKLGSGGYGDVWLADAPGGLKKAIKFVNGSIDEDRASSELKSLQRIRQVNHPFILSLERIEVIQGQLIIVTELAQGSLYDRLHEYRLKGFVGISRERLLGYMRDAADGLDFLCQQHDLQHLDVKPANLLLVADRVKVADFGLIKDIQSNSLSVMGGLTPTYAAPEMFDGRPGRFSDQYSLAIVYQELLTGTLPFRGRTTAQLANEHLHKAPNLEAIPLLERPILSKALAKKPQMRFSDCREFIQALERVHLQAVESADQLNKNSKLKPRAAGKNALNKHPRTPSAPEGEGANQELASRFRSMRDKQPQNNERTEEFPRINRTIELLPALEPLNAEEHSNALEGSGLNETLNAPIFTGQNKTLTIGIGESGAQALLLLRRTLLEYDKNRLNNANRGFLLLDTDKDTIERALDCDREEHLPFHAAVHLPLKTPQYYRESTPSNFPQISRRWVYNIPRSLKTEGVRPLGMLAYLDNAVKVFDAIQDSIVEIAHCHGVEACGEPLSVQIVGSAHGGTGSAIFSEIGFLIRQLAAEFDVPISVELILTCATPNGAGVTDLKTATALSCLMEISNYFRSEGLHPSIEHLPPSRAINQPPFDHVTLVYGGQCGCNDDWLGAISQVSDYLWSITETELGARIANAWRADLAIAHETTDSNWTYWLSTVSTRQVEVKTKTEPEVSASRTCLRNALPWLSALNAIISSHTDMNSPEEPVESKLLEQMDFFVGDMFRTNQWTAQAWVHQCMVCLVTQDSTNLASEGEPRPVGHSSAQPITENLLCANVKQELNIVCEQLALESRSARNLVSQLIASTRTKLIEWVVGRWLTNQSAWASMKPLLRLIASRFSINANSLRVVAEKLSEKHDAALEKLYNGTLKASPEIDQQLHATALEARFHSMASKMLSRLSEHLSYLEDIWTNECAMLHKDLYAWSTELAKKLGIPYDKSPQSQTALNILLRSGSYDPLSKQVRKALLGLACDRLASGFSVEDVRETKPVATDPLDAIFQLTLERITQAEATATPQKSTTISSGPPPKSEPHTNSPITEITQPRFPTTGITANGDKILNSAERPSLATEIDASRPYFADFGGAIRNMVVLPSQIARHLEPMEKHELDDKQAAVVVCEVNKSTTIVCLGERLVLKDIMDRVWMPSTDTWQLANRLLSRVDIDWLPINV